MPLTVALLLNSCGIGLGQLPVQTAIVLDSEPERFIFFVCPHKWLVAGDRIGWRTPAARFEIWRSDDLLWEIAARDRRYGVEEIIYGVVPDGFDQRTPKNNAPPPKLKAGEAYKAIAVWIGYGITTFTFGPPADNATICP
jgi:hypothetical protein